MGVLNLINHASTVAAYSFEQVQELVKLNQRFAQEIEELKRPQGEWIDVDGDGSLWKCSKCGEIHCCHGKYCSNCGADMTGKKEVNKNV